MEVRVYFNLNKKCFSIQTKTERGWRVKEYKDSLALHNCKFKVYESGRQRVLKTKRKNVHAYIEGYMLNFDLKDFWKDEYGLTPVFYNPYKNPSFITEDNKIVRVSKTTILKTVDGKGYIKIK
jgi:hypothetical protein